MQANIETADINGVLMPAPCPYCGVTPEQPNCFDLTYHLPSTCMLGNSSWHVEDWNQRASRWIPVSERLPEEGVEVLVYAPKGAKCIYSKHERPELWEESTWVDSRKDDAIGGWSETYYLPTHWQPLPEAPHA